MASSHTARKLTDLIAALIVAVLAMGGAPGFASGATSYDILHAFENPPSQPNRLLRASNGALYGTTQRGGAFGVGTLFRVQPDGTAFTILHSFDLNASYPGGLLQGSDGALYGVTAQGGIVCGYGCGTVFRIDPDGTGFTVLHTFNWADGASPLNGLIQGSDGTLYGTTSNGGVFLQGTIYSLRPDGTGFTVLHSFTGVGNPIVELIQGSDGMLYGTTPYGGATNYGTLFRLKPDGTGFTVLHSFDSNGSYPSSVLQGSDGALYGTTGAGGAFGFGTVFTLKPDGTGFTILHGFDSANGGHPSSLLQGIDGALCGTTNARGWLATACDLGCGTIFTLRPDGTGFGVLHAFDATSGVVGPGLVQGSDGTLYGTTSGGGAPSGQVSYGTIFGLKPDGTGFTILHPFEITDGANPTAGLLQGSDGALYGTTSEGGAFGYGTVFTLKSDGTGFTIIHTFDGTDAFYPSGLNQGLDGALYGTASGGGASGHVGYGAIFTLKPDGSGFSVLHAFDGTYGALDPGLLQESHGALYGVTTQGSSGCLSCPPPQTSGSVFTIRPDGTGFTTLYVFAGGGGPVGGLIESKDGGLYGIASGTIYRLNADGTGFTELHSFLGGPYGGPAAGLLLGSDGALYGTTYGGGLNGGSVFRINLDGTGFSILHAFNYFPDGASRT